MKKIYCIGIGGIGVSALARYYHSQGYEVFGSDTNNSALIESLQIEGINIIIGQDACRIDESFEKIIYSEAVPTHQKELQKAQSLNIKTLKYNQALAEIANPHKLIAISGTHGKSTTTSLISLILKQSPENFTSIVGTLLKEFDGRNCYTQKINEHENYFVIEACEYKEHFLAYQPLVLVITNIEFDHADYFKTPENYISAFKKMILQVRTGGFVIYSSADKNSQALISLRQDIHFVGVSQKYFSPIHPSQFSPYKGEMKSQQIIFPEIKMKVPGEHILLDAKLAYVVGHMLGLSDLTILHALESYTGVWRRMEKIGITEHGNILMSDYGHHPTEISVTLQALKQGYPDKKIFVLFQPHQYSRTLELLEGFQNCFGDANTVVIPNIYASRDSKEDIKKISAESFVTSIHHSQVIFGDGLKNTLELIKKYDRSNPHSSIILLQGAGDIDTLRYNIKTS